MCHVFILVRVQDGAKQHCLFEVLPHSTKSNANECSAESVTNYLKCGHRWSIFLIVRSSVTSQINSL